MLNTIKKTIIIVLLVLSNASFAAGGIAGRIDRIINRPSQKKVNFSVHVVNAGTSRSVYSFNEHKAMIPASNMKIVTTAAALDVLGSDFEYKTVAGLCGDDLVVIGSGDPLLGDERTDKKYLRQKGWLLDKIVERIRQRGVRSVNNIVIDTTVFDDMRVHPSWPVEQLNKWYACEVSGLNYNNNCIQMTTSTASGRVSISIQPRTDYIKIINKVRAIKSGKGAVGAYRTTEANKLVVKGKCKKKQGPFAVAIEEPAGLFGHLLRAKLLEAGIKVRGEVAIKPVSRNCEFAAVTEYRTPIADCLARCNKDSLGLAAEALLKTMGAYANLDRKGGSWQGGQHVVTNYLSGLGVDGSEFFIDDGSGLSRENRLSAYAITKVLLDVYNGDSWLLYKESLAAGGVDGTIRKYFREKKYKGKIFGKTGYIAGVKSFSGVCITDNGDYVFSILTNKANGKSRGAINDIAKAIFD